MRLPAKAAAPTPFKATLPTATKGIADVTTDAGRKAIKIVKAIAVVIITIPAIARTFWAVNKFSRWSTACDGFSTMDDLDISFI
jgi:hypothetical protein